MPAPRHKPDYGRAVLCCFYPKDGGVSASGYGKRVGLTIPLGLRSALLLGSDITLPRDTSPVQEPLWVCPSLIFPPGNTGLSSFLISSLLDLFSAGTGSDAAVFHSWLASYVCFAQASGSDMISLPNLKHFHWDREDFYKSNWNTE